MSQRSRGAERCANDEGLSSGGEHGVLGELTMPWKNSLHPRILLRTKWNNKTPGTSAFGESPIRRNKGLDRFTLRGQKNVDGQWKLYCMVHNIEKLAHHGYAQ